MGLFRTSLTIRHIANRSGFVTVPDVLVDTGTTVTTSWIPDTVLESIGIERQKKNHPFQMADGQIITRGVGYAVVQSDSFETIDEVVFAEAGDVALLGVRTLEGFNAMVDPTNKRLVAAGPIPAAGNVRS
jgi:predicted aspartyl protease